MSLLHTTFIPYKTRSLLKNRKERHSMNYRQAQRIGILFSMSSFHDFEAIRKFEGKLKKDGKEVVSLSYMPEDAENFEFHFDFFTQKDFTFFGGIQAENIGSFLQQPFDLLLYLDQGPNLYLEYLLAASAARFRIGPYICDREALFELMVRLPEGSDLTELLNQIYHYTNEL